jgi:hypothetical protein
MKPRRQILPILAAVLFLAVPGFTQDDPELFDLAEFKPEPFRLGGSVKALLLGYDLSDVTLDLFDREASLATSLRLTLTGDPTDRFGYEMHILFRDELVTDPVAAALGATTEARNPLFRGLGDGSTWVDGNRHTLIADVAYANLQWSNGRTDVVLGRQAITFGRSFFWNPVDWLSTFSPTEIDREYKTGVDAVRLTRYMGRFSGVELVYAYGDGGDRDSSATIGRVFGNLNEWDLELLAGSVWIDDRYGFAFSGDVKGAGVRGEISHNMPRNGPDPDFTSGTLEIDYRWDSSLQLITELHYNGFGSTDPDDYASLFLNRRIVTGQVQNIGRDYLASSLGTEFTPLITGTMAVLLNLHDRSGILSPTLQISLGDESSLAAGAIVPWGDGPTLSGLPSEYGAYPLSVWVQFRHYF